MAMPFLSSKPQKRRDSIVAIDLGGNTTKAVNVQRRGEGFVLSGFAMMDAPVSEKTVSADLMAEHLQNVGRALEGRSRSMSVAVGVNESIMRHTELPLMPLEDMRMVLKNNTRTYLQQEYTNHVFDCHVIPSKQLNEPSPKGKNTGIPRQKVLVAGAKVQFLDDLQTAVRSAGFVPDHVIPNLVGPVNAFELAMPEVFATDVVALIDLGFRNTTISLLQEGELIMSRVVGIGGDRLTTELADLMNVSYAEAEGIKIGMPVEIQPQLEALVAPLGRELRASMDFYEHQYDRAVSKAYLSGGSARSDLILEMLQTELMVECVAWNPVGFMQISVPPQQAAEIEQVAPQLAVAVGAAMATF